MKLINVNTMHWTHKEWASNPLDEDINVMDQSWIGIENTRSLKNLDILQFAVLLFNSPHDQIQRMCGLSCFAFESNIQIGVY